MALTIQQYRDQGGICSHVARMGDSASVCINGTIVTESRDVGVG